jgi:hypothetical protein
MSEITGGGPRARPRSGDPLMHVTILDRRRMALAR